MSGLSVLTGSVVIKERWLSNYGSLNNFIGSLSSVLTQHPNSSLEQEEAHRSERSFVFC